MTALLATLERQADGLPTQPRERVRAPFTPADLLAEIDEHAAACRALAEVALGRGLTATPFELSQLVLEHLGMAGPSGIDQIRAAMIEDAVVVHAGGGPVARLRRPDPWDVLFGTMDAIAGLARLLAARLGGRASAYVRLAFDVPDVPDAPGAPDRPADRGRRTTSHPAGTGPPSDTVNRVQQWAADRAPHHDADLVDPHDVRLEVQRRGKAITIVEHTRVRDPAPHEPEWHEARIAQLRWVPAESGWSLHYADRRDRWHDANGRVASPDLDELLALIDADPYGQFWG
jgi:hypothetical protein